MVLAIFLGGGGKFPSKMRQSMGGGGQKSNKITPTAKNLPKSNLYVLICLEKYPGGGGESNLESTSNLLKLNAMRKFKPPRVIIYTILP